MSTLCLAIEVSQDMNWGCERFHLYLVGTQFDLFTDHKPMEMIYSLKAKPPKRIERRLLRLQQYKLNIKYRPDNSNPANVLSRQPYLQTTDQAPQQRVCRL